MLTDENKDPSCPPVRIVAFSPYGQPTWHPSGQFIGFNHTPLERINYPYGEACYGEYTFKQDAAGFWTIAADGTQQHRIFPEGFDAPAWSPDGAWLAFHANAQIYKIRFTGEGFDPESLVQLTHEGRNFYPTWSPDGEWIAYDNTSCGGGIDDDPLPPNACGILVMKNNGSEQKLLARGRYPNWSPDGDHIVYVGLQRELFSISTRDTSNGTRITSFNQEDAYATDNRHPKYSPDGSKIAFTSRLRTEHLNIWVMNADGTALRQLTTEGAADWFDWSPDGRRIVYVDYFAGDWSYENGTLWIVDIETGEKHQLTYNPKPEGGRR